MGASTPAQRPEGAAAPVGDVETDDAATPVAEPMTDDAAAPRGGAAADDAASPANDAMTDDAAAPSGAASTDAPAPDAVEEPVTATEVSSQDEVPAGAVRVDAGSASSRRRPTEHFTARTKARQRALDVLFEADAKGAVGTTDALLRVLDERRSRTIAQDGLPAYAIELVQGVADHVTLIDEVLTETSHGWSIRRMPAVDRGLLRLGVLEVVFLDDVEDAVAIEQAAVLARTLSTDDSARFVSGVLGEVSRNKDLYRS